MTSKAFAAYTCKLTVAELPLTFKGDTATGHKTKLQSLAMQKYDPSGYLLDNVRTYLIDYIGEIQCNPALVDSTKKGATDKQANTWSIDWIQPVRLQALVKVHDTKQH